MTCTMYFLLFASIEVSVFDFRPFSISIYKMITYAECKRADKYDYIRAMYIVSQQDEGIYGDDVSRGNRIIERNALDQDRELYT